MTRWNNILAAVTTATFAMPVVLHGETYIYTPGQQYAPTPVYQTPQAIVLTDQQLDQLLGPIALYPDPLLTQVLAAATYPQDVNAAAQWLQSFPSASENDINAQPWDPSVKAIVHYPTVLQALASQPDWTANLGAAFAGQQQQVMDSIQRLRAEAQRANTLVSTPQQQVVSDGGYVQILPAQPNVVYVPTYDPGIVYVGSPGYSQPFITYSPGFAVGAWFDLGWDWRNHRIDRGYHWDRDWRHPDVGHSSPWQHDPGRPIPRARFPEQRPHGADFRPGDRGPDRNSVFDPRFAPRNENHINAPRSNERPVNGLGDHHDSPMRDAPREAPHDAPRGVQPAPVFHPPTPGNIHEPMRPIERPVQGLNRPTPAPISTPAPVQRAAPSPAPSGGVFRPGGGGAAIQSSRGSASMGGGGGHGGGGGRHR